MRWALALALAATALPALWPGDVPVADAIWASATELGGADWTARVYSDAAVVQHRVAPWQAGFGRARARLDALAAGRRAALPDDRGGRRRP